MNSEITTLDLFSGIGGFSLGLETAGPFRTVAFCEREPFPQAVLRKHWPGVPIYDDVRTIPTDELGRIDIITGGFPCQPWSVAGEQRGAEDDRDLWPAMATLIEKLRPQWVIGENVRGFVNEPLGLARTITDLHGIGYQVVTFILPAAGVGAPHRRDRVWIVANTESAGIETRRGDRLGIDNRSRGDAGQSASASGQADVAVSSSIRLQKHGHSKSKDVVQRSKDVADADDTRSQGRKQRRASGEGEGASRPATQRSEDGGPLKWIAQPGICDMAHGVPRWLDEPDCGRVATGVKNRAARLKALGNAIVPQVVEQIGRAIIQSHYSID